MRLSHSDYRRLNNAIAAMYRRAFVVGPAAAISETLVTSLRGVNAVAGCLRGTEVVAFHATEPVFAALLIATTPEVARYHPRFQRADLAGNALLLSDFVSRKDWSETDLYHTGWGELAYEDDLGMNIGLSNGNLMSVALMRERRTFREEDREIFALLAPHMQTLFAPPSDPDVSALGGLGLTRREQEVLFWVSEGKRNSEIAGILGISPGTVKRHLENLYRKLGVENRQGAARRALEKIHPFA